MTLINMIRKRMNTSLSARVKRRNLVHKPGEIELMEEPITKTPAYLIAPSRIDDKLRQQRVNKIVDYAKSIIVGRHKHIGSVSLYKIKNLIAQYKRAVKNAA